MAKSDPLRRYIFIIKQLSTKQYPSLEQMLDYLAQHDLDVSERTLQRDIEALRTSFDIKVPYDAFEKGYFLQENQKFPLDDFMRIAELKLRSDLLMDTMNDVNHNHDFISFDGSDGLKGIEHLESLLGAISNKHIVKFEYTRFFNSATKNHTVKPYHLKEYNGRWYLLAMTTKGLTTFALDRFDSLKITNKPFKRDNKIDPKENFLSQIGISWGDEDPTIVRLLFAPDQANYVKTLPWHFSQKQVNEDENGLEIELFLTINFELEQKILAQGNRVKVLEPASLANQVKAIHQSALEQY